MMAGETLGAAAAGDDDNMSSGLIVKMELSQDWYMLWLH
jgi:hypothetical protein